MKRHSWNATDDLIALFLQLFYPELDKLRTETIAIKFINTSYAGLKLRMRNHLYLLSDGKKGTKNVAKLTRENYKQFGKANQTDVLSKINNSNFLDFYYKSIKN